MTREADDGMRSSAFERMSVAITRFAGSTTAFLAALGLVLAWAISGPVFGFSPTWQLVINTGTTIVTFLMVFLIQRSQNKEAQALHLKLNELLAATRGASSRLLNLEDHSEEELRVLHRHYRELARLAREEGSITDSHSIEEAEARHRAKGGGGGPA
jgi:low affinity Fe/Cu permease